MALSYRAFSVPPPLLFIFLASFLFPTASSKIAAPPVSSSAARPPPPPLHRHHQNILIFRANISAECADKCILVVVEENLPRKINTAPATPTNTTNTTTPLSTWNTLSVSLNTHVHNTIYSATVHCTGLCQSTSNRPLLLWSAPPVENNITPYSLLSSSSSSSSSNNIRYHLLTQSSNVDNRTTTRTAILQVHRQNVHHRLHWWCGALFSQNISWLKIGAGVWVITCPLAAWIVNKFFVSF